MRRTTHAHRNGALVSNHQVFSQGHHAAASSVRSDTGFALEHVGVSLENQIVEAFTIFRIPRHP
jgi:hypothetical protein